VATAGDLADLRAAVEADPTVTVTIDVDACRVHCGDRSFPVHIPDTAREALISGHWDAIADLIEGIPSVEATAAQLPYMRK
jgi:3-isopropylmalate/(R)-2-methylmalate dehydratase small subunit